MTQVRKHRLRSGAPAPEGANLSELASPALFRSLGDPNRIALLIRLASCGRPCSVSEMADCCPVDFSVVSRHLARLREGGVLEATKVGREVYYRVRTETLAPTLRAIAEILETCCRRGQAGCGRPGAGACGERMEVGKRSQRSEGSRRTKATRTTRARPGPAGGAR